MSEENAGWPAAATPAGHVILRLDEGNGEDPRYNLSAATRVGRSLFVAGDEKAIVELLTPDPDDRWSTRARYPLADLLDLMEPEAEVDIEGLSASDGWLWVVGSHARTRNKPDKAADLRIDLDKLADLKDTRARCVLARLPLAADADAADVFIPVRVDGSRRAGMVRQGKAGNKLARMLRSDPLLGPFTRIPAKEGGIDIEGIAVSANRVALGMRGPVIRDYAVLLEVRIDPAASGRLKLASRPTTRLLDLEGLGIRDLKLRGDHLLILAGPTSSLSGPCALYVWRNWASEPPRDGAVVALHRPERLFDLPFGRGVDHPEGLALWDAAEDAERILVLCDSPASARFEAGTGLFKADVFDLPL